MYFRNPYERSMRNSFFNDAYRYCTFMYMYRQRPPHNNPHNNQYNPNMGGNKDRPPMGPPPNTIPKQSKTKSGAKAVDPGSMRPCLYRYTYIWLKNGNSFWAWLNYVGKNSIAGWRWKRFYWVYFGMDSKKIDSFVCY